MSEKCNKIFNGIHGKIHCCNLLDYEYHTLKIAGFHLVNNDVTTFPYFTAVDKTSYHIRKKKHIVTVQFVNFFTIECFLFHDCASLWKKRDKKYLK